MVLPRSGRPATWRFRRYRVVDALGRDAADVGVAQRNFDTTRSWFVFRSTCDGGRRPRHAACCPRCQLRSAARIETPMHDQLPPIPTEGAVQLGTDTYTAPPGGRSLATRDRDVIREWATQHSAQPALDVTTQSAARVPEHPPTVRFNFP